MNIPARAADLSRRLDSWVERLCVLLLVLLVLDVWLGVLVRFVIPLPLTFTEEAARYLMIWAALLAVSSGIASRGHIGVLVIFEAFPPRVRQVLAVLFDLLAFGFFAFLFVYGLGFVERGLSRFTMIYGLSKALPFAAVPTAAAIACVQIALVALRDLHRHGGGSGADRLEV